MSTENFTAGVLALIGGLEDPLQPPDQTFLDEMEALIGSAPKVRTSNVPVEQIPSQELPCLVVEQGDGQTQSITEGSSQFMDIGGYEQQFSSTLAIALVWRDQDRTRAFEARTRLPEIFARLLLRNPTPGGVAGAWLTRWEPDRAVNHPLHIWACEIRGDYVTQND